jgi:hypothetical protein
MSDTNTLIANNGKITRAELAQLPTPPATATHLPIPHTAVVETLVETLSYRHIGVVGEEFAVSIDAMEMFGVLDLETSFEGCRFAIGIRNANNKRFRLSCTVGLRVFVCQNLAFRGDYTPVLAKHSKHFSLEDALSTGVDRMQRNFDPMRLQVERWRAQQLPTDAAKLMIYQAFIEGDLDVPKHLARRVHDLYLTLSIRSLSREPCGASQTRLRRLLRIWIRSRNSGQQRNRGAILNPSVLHDHQKAARGAKERLRLNLSKRPRDNIRRIKRV